MSAETPRRHDASNTLNGDVNSGNVTMAGRMRDVNYHFHGSSSVPSTPEVPMQVEPPPPDFVNHDETLRWIREQLDPDGAPTVVVCSGPLGIGKSSLLRQAAYAMDDYFTGGQLIFEYTRGRQEDSEVALQQFLRALGVHKDALPEDPRIWAGEYRTRTRDKRMLVVVEGAWEPAQVRGLIPSGRGSLVLVSGDGPDLGELELHPGACVHDLSPLAGGSARDLLAQRAGRDLSEEDPESLSRLLEICAGLPLALVLVGAQLRRKGPGSARALAMRTRGTHGALRAIGDERTNLDVLFHTAYRALTPGAAALYRLLGTWPGPRCAGSAVAAVADAEAVAELVSANLVESGGDGSLRFRHDLVRVHARDRAEKEDGARESRQGLVRMLDAYLVTLGFAERAARGERLRVVDLDMLVDGDDPFAGEAEIARTWLAGERHTLLAVVLDCADTGLHEHAWRFAELSTSLYLDQRHLHDWAASGQAGADSARLVENQAAEARLASLVSRPLTDLGRQEQAEERIERAVTLAAQVGDALLSGSVWEFYGRHLESSDAEAAIAAYDRSARHNRTSDSHLAPRGRALAVLFRGRARVRAGQYAEAVTDIEEARTRLLNLSGEPDRRMAARAEAELGRAHAAAGDPEEAAKVLRAANEELAAGGWHYYRAEVCETLSEVLRELGDSGGARGYAEVAERIYRGLGSPRARRLAARLEED